ncbi:hypothetical protein WA026_009985 [Henosepilachna vigintioctopunctata]|uniref:Glucose-methanol-choline oxidoreductase N-terminal domain-containing protein n=1 Tax=Henosepilachna vigintioctopunctata TaxID=420089 RepID=A0AAW1TRW4_9CUCU
MFILLFLIISPHLVYSCDEVTKNKIDFLEALINDSIEKSKDYKVRTDNSNFFVNTNDSAIPIEYGTFDFIVVGAGSSGSVVSSRLSEVEKWDILLLEAGDLNDDLTEIPYLYELLQLSERNWGYFTTPQKNGCFGRKNRQCPYHRGKVVGGSGSINGLGFTRGNRGDYDKWASLGNLGWSYDDLLPYFKKMENFESDNIDLRYRGFGGPLNVAYKEPKQDISDIVYCALKRGKRYTEDYNAKDQLGISRYQRNIRCGKRESGATAYVRPSMTRHNFNLTLEAFVTKIVIDQTTKTANGVEFMKNGKKYKASSRREVIISGGAVNSPQLLMLSGIGPADELRKHNIPIIQELPVGQYLKDHPAFRIEYRSNQTVPKQSFRQLLEKFVQGKGMLTNLENTLTYTFVNTKNTSTVPDLECIFIASNPVPIKIPSLTNYIPEVENYYKNVNQQTDYSIVVLLLHPQSVGSLKLKSKDPRDFPLIDVGIFSAPEDLEMFYKATKFFELFEELKYPQRMNFTMLTFDFCNEFKKNSKEYWYCAIQNISYSAYHISSTVKMGQRQDPHAVVDNRLKVYGIEKLRVADCSIMPTTISGHTNAACFVIGERAADWIKLDYGIPILF